MAVAQGESARNRAGPAPAPAGVFAAGRVLRGGKLVAAAAVAAVVASHLAYFGLFDREAGVLNADAEQGAWAWASTASAFAAAFAALVLAALERGTARRRISLACLLALFSLDDAVQLHEDYGEEFTEGILGLPERAAHAVWPVLFLPLLAAALLLLVREARAADRAAARVLSVGAALLAAAVALEAVAAVLDPDTWLGAIEIALEEGFELGGWVLIATALASLVLRAAARTP